MAERSKNDYPMDFIEPLIQYIRHYEHHQREASDAWAAGRKLIREWLTLQPHQEKAIAWLTSQPFAPMGLVIPHDIVQAVCVQPVPAILPVPPPPPQALAWCGEVHSYRNADDDLPYELGSSEGPI